MFGARRTEGPFGELLEGRRRKPFYSIHNELFVKANEFFCLLCMRYHGVSLQLVILRNLKPPPSAQRARIPDLESNTNCSLPSLKVRRHGPGKSDVARTSAKAEEEEREGRSNYSSY